jgi:hypothetical protein
MQQRRRIYPNGIEAQALTLMTRLSCHRFRANEVRLWLRVLAYNLGNLWRCPRGIGKVVADQLATTLGEDGRLPNEARPLLLALAGRESSDPAAVCGDARYPQRDEGSQPLHYAPHWVYAEPNGEGQNVNSGRYHQRRLVCGVRCESDPTAQYRWRRPRLTSFLSQKCQQFSIDLLWRLPLEKVSIMP